MKKVIIPFDATGMKGYIYKKVGAQTVRRLIFSMYEPDYSVKVISQGPQIRLVPLPPIAFVAPYAISSAILALT